MFFVFPRVVVITGAFYVILIENIFVNTFLLLTITASTWDKASHTVYI